MAITNICIVFYKYLLLPYVFLIYERNMFYHLSKIINLVEANRSGGAQSVTVKPSGCGFDLYSREMKYLFKFIFPFLRSGVEAAVCEIQRKADKKNS